ncbi:MAG: GtrA family protein [Clostridia bacterium]|nr:GtrA family protein [Clostridia bacterium]
MKNKKEIISYLFFGVLTTVISIASFQAFGFILGEKLYLLNNILSWIISVAFAFFTNKLWVFESKSFKFSVIKGEIIGFLSARIFSLVLEEAGLFFMIDLIKFSAFKTEILGFTITGELIAKLIMQIIVVIANYIFSKFIIFKRKKQNELD